MQCYIITPWLLLLLRLLPFFIFSSSTSTAFTRSLQHNFVCYFFRSGGKLVRCCGPLGARANTLSFSSCSSLFACQPLSGCFPILIIWCNCAKFLSIFLFSCSPLISAPLSISSSLASFRTSPRALRSRQRIFHAKFHVLQIFIFCFYSLRSGLRCLLPCVRFFIQIVSMYVSN